MRRKLFRTDKINPSLISNKESQVVKRQIKSNLVLLIKLIKVLSIVRQAAAIKKV